MRALPLPLLLACTAPVEKEVPRRGPPGEDFTTDSSVRIRAPSNGATVSPDFALVYDAGADVQALSVDVAGAVVTRVEEPEGHGSFILTLPEGRHSLALQGLDAEGALLSEHRIQLRVEDQLDDPWVTITSPADGATVPNPVLFTVEQSTAVDSVELLADDWSLGFVEGGLLSYEFSGTGFPRQIEALGYDAEGGLVATDLIEITAEEPSTAPDSAFNAVVLRHIDEIMEGVEAGEYGGYYWPDTGSWGGNPDDIDYLGDLFAPGDSARRSYCVGITLQVFMQSWQELEGEEADLNGIPFEELYEFRTDWYVRELYGSGVVEALENYGVGDRVSRLEDIQPGDFLQFWRHSGSGHNNIFIDWEREDGEIIGLTYWSTQGSTDGPGYHSEYFGSSGSSIDPAFFFAGRVREPADWER